MGGTENTYDAAAIEDAAPLQFFSRQLQVIVTLRGIVILGLVAFLFFGPVLKSVDIVAAVVACSLLGILILVGAVSLLKGRGLRRAIQVHLAASRHADDTPAGETLVAGEPAQLLLRTSPFRIPPFFTLQAELDFEKEDLPLPAVCFTGVSPDARLARERIVFPHRGVWSIGRLRLTFGDRLGLTSFFWDIDALDAGGVFTVSVRESEIEPLPVVSSSHKAGDMMIHTRDRLGDPYDLKPYHPADGLKRILWKVFAKSGELISRHSECSMTPEGQVVLYCCAGRDEDYLCADFLAYLSRLEALELVVTVGFEGMRKHEAEPSRAAAETLMVESVWDSEELTIDEMRAEILAILRSAESQCGGASMHRLVFFVGTLRLGDKAWRERLMDIAQFVSQHGIRPCFIVRKPKLGAASLSTTFDLPPVLRIFQGIFITPQARKTKNVSNGAEIFAHVAEQEGWEVLV